MKCLVKEQVRMPDKKRGEKFVFVDQGVFDVNVTPRTIDDIQSAVLKQNKLVVKVFSVSSLQVEGKYIQFHGYVMRHDQFLGKKTAFPIQLRCYPK